MPLLYFMVKYEGDRQTHIEYYTLSKVMYSHTKYQDSTLKDRKVKAIRKTNGL